MRSHVRWPVVRVVTDSRAFTIVELLVSMAILTLLISAAVYAMRTVRRASSRTVTLNALRQVMLAYTGYTQEHNGKLMPGYVDPDMLQNVGANDPQKLNLFARLPTGQHLNRGDTAPYVWRLAPYLDNAWKTYMADYRSTQIESQFNAEYDNASAGGAFGLGTYSASGSPPDFGIGICTSIGLNSIYVGGDSFHGTGVVPTLYSPWGTPNANVANASCIAATRLTQVKNPAKLIVFGATRRAYPDEVPQVAPANLSQGHVVGYVELRPSWLPSDDNPGYCVYSQWELDSDNQLIPGEGWHNGPGGLLHDRVGAERVPIACMDGSVVLRNPLDFVLDETLEPIPKPRFSR